MKQEEKHADNTNEDYVLKKYDEAIQYYWNTSRHNKNTYKTTRSLVVILGAIVTLVASLASASFIESNAIWNNVFAVASPVLAGILTIAGGLSQSFRWGATWRDSVLNAQRLENERDRIVLKKPEERDQKVELDLMHDLVITETDNFFQRILGGVKSEKEVK